MPRIELIDVSKRFGKFVAVDLLNMVIEDGSFISLLGPSGCGKTTTLRMIAGLETPTEGRIIIDGKTVFDSKRQIDLSPAKRDIGFLFQNYALWPHMTVYQNIAFGLENLKWSKEDIRANVEKLLAMLRIDEFAARYPAELSGGQQQRVAIARTLATNPKVLLMDEPLSNLDAKLRMEMRTELKRLHVETGATFVYVTHDQLEAMTLSSKICLLDKGVLQQYDRPLGVYNKPVNTFTADFVGNPAINLLPVEVQSVKDGNVMLSNEAMHVSFKPTELFSVAKGEKVTLGLRPELISVTDASEYKVEVYSSLPSGMETIVRFKIGEAILNAVVFGSLDFPVGSSVGIHFTSDKLLVFHADGRLLGTGSVQHLTHRK